MAPLMFDKKQQKVLQASKMSSSNASKIQKPEQIIGEKFISLIGTLIDDLGQNHEEVNQECLITVVTFAS